MYVPGRQNNTIELQFSLIPNYWEIFCNIGLNLWPNIPRSKKCVEEVKTSAINPGWNFLVSNTTLFIYLIHSFRQNFNLHIYKINANILVFTMILSADVLFIMFIYISM